MPPLLSIINRVEDRLSRVELSVSVDTVECEGYPHPSPGHYHTDTDLFYSFTQMLLARLTFHFQQFAMKIWHLKI